ncbi:MAG: hypothetical protein AAFO82_20780, partial [Bacteroidota bacterium]
MLEHAHKLGEQLAYELLSKNYLEFMKIVITTDVEQDYQTVWSRFDEQLFTALKPPLMPLQLLRFDGSLKGDEVHLKIAGQLWIAEIIEQAELPEEIYFVDKG